MFLLSFLRCSISISFWGSTSPAGKRVEFIDLEGWWTCPEVSLAAILSRCSRNEFKTLSANWRTTSLPEIYLRHQWWAHDQHSLKVLWELHVSWQDIGSPCCWSWRWSSQDKSSCKGQDSDREEKKKLKQHRSDDLETPSPGTRTAV